jgi:hypothetical protein
MWWDFQTSLHLCEREDRVRQHPPHGGHQVRQEAGARGPHQGQGQSHI